MRKPWFGVKSYGVGYGPRSAEGWAVLAGYGLAVADVHGAAMRLHLPAWAEPLAVVVLTAALLAVARFTTDGAPVRWRWGGR